MSEALYENHTYSDKSLPIFFHRDKIGDNYTSIFSHWHESLELLFIYDQPAFGYLDGEQFEVNAGDILVVNTEIIHNIIAKNEYTCYYCLIISREFCEQFGFDIKSTRLDNVIRDEKIFSYIKAIAAEMNEKKPYYSARIMASVLNILSGLYGDYVIDTGFVSKDRKSVIMVKRAIDYIGQNYMKKLNVSEVAEFVGYSKYHFCREFKMFTGNTVVGHISRLKIEQANKMLREGLSITAVAEKCGIDDVSYFTKLFKKYKGILPSTAAKKHTPKD